jgi:hypothetical protein
VCRRVHPITLPRREKQQQAAPQASPAAAAALHSGAAAFTHKRAHPLPVPPANAGNPSPHLRQLMAYVKATWPFFNRRGGADHIIFLPGDFGACEIDESDADLGPMIKISHWGYYSPNGSYPFHRMSKVGLRRYCAPLSVCLLGVCCLS